jgi:hypothetical protein
MKDWYYKTTEPIDSVKDRFIFTNVRNIYSWLVSYLEHAAGWTKKYRNTDHYDYKIAQKGFDYLINTIANREYPWPCRKFIFFQIFASNGDLVVDWINRKESLDYDLSQMAKYAGLNYRAKEKKRVGVHKDYRHYYDDSIIELVEDIWGRELALFGYNFNGCNDNKTSLYHNIDKQTKSQLKYNLNNNTLSYRGLKLVNV